MTRTERYKNDVENLSPRHTKLFKEMFDDIEIDRNGWGYIILDPDLVQSAIKAGWVKPEDVCYDPH